MGRDEDDGNGHRRLAQAFLQFEATQPPEVDIQHQAADMAEARRGQQVLARGKRLHGEAERSQQALNGSQDGGVVIDHSDHLSHIDLSEPIVQCQEVFHRSRTGYANLTGVNIGPWSYSIGTPAATQGRGRSRPSFSASRTRSGTVATRILSMTRARWTLMVFSAMPSSPAICLLSMPATTSFSTSRSRVVSEACRSASSACSA